MLIARSAIPVRLECACVVSWGGDCIIVKSRALSRTKKNGKLQLFLPVTSKSHSERGKE